MRTATPPMPLTDSQREILESLSRSRTAPHRQVQRARALLFAGQGLANTGIAGQVGVSPSTVQAWRDRFAEQGLVKFGEVATGRGRKPSISEDKIAEIVRATQETTPPGQTHWSCRAMAKAQGVSPATVQRIWSARGLKPHLVKTFKLSNDPKFEEKLIDVVGLYLNPPEGATSIRSGNPSSPQMTARTNIERAARFSHVQPAFDHECPWLGFRAVEVAAEPSSGPLVVVCRPVPAASPIRRASSAHSWLSLRLHVSCSGYSNPRVTAGLTCSGPSQGLALGSSAYSSPPSWIGNSSASPTDVMVTVTASRCTPAPGVRPTVAEPWPALTRSAWPWLKFKSTIVVLVPG